RALGLAFGHADDDFLEQRRGSVDQVDVAVGDRIEGAGIDGNAAMGHGSGRLQGAGLAPPSVSAPPVPRPRYRAARACEVRSSRCRCQPGGGGGSLPAGLSTYSQASAAIDRGSACNTASHRPAANGGSTNTMSAAPAAA